MKNIFITTFPILIIINTITSVDQWSKFPIGTTSFNWLINAIIIFFILWYKSNHFKTNNKSDYVIILIYLLWLLIGVLRGMFVADNYWEWKQLLSGSFTLLLPLFVYIFSNPYILKKTLNKWIIYALPIFFALIFFISTDAYHFYLGPVLFLSCFTPIIPSKWRYLFIILLAIMIVVDLGARSQVIKAMITLIMSVICLFSKYISTRALKIIHHFFYILPIILLTLGITGMFNPFQDLVKENLISRKMINKHAVENNLSADTRTFIYKEVITSAFKNDYIFCGRTPARGNDSDSFGTYNAETLKTNKYERHSNEVAFPNIFTWLGLVGMFLYCLIYFKASYLAIYKSNNIFIKLLGIYISFRFTYGWIEDSSNFSIMNITLWMIISMGFSEHFRAMSDSQFKSWIKSIFNY